MPVSRYTVGPGTLTLGVEDATAQVTDMAVEWSESVNTTDAVPTLDGGEIAAEDEATLSAVLTGNVVQDIAAGGLVDFTWLHGGEEVAFVYSPNNAADRQITGTVRIIPIKLGGTVKDKAPRSDISWACVAPLPVLGAMP